MHRLSLITLCLGLAVVTLSGCYAPGQPPTEPVDAQSRASEDWLWGQDYAHVQDIPEDVANLQLLASTNENTILASSATTGR